MSTLDRLKEAVKGIAPTLAASLVPGGPLVAAAVKSIGEAVLGKSHASPDELLPAVQALTPEAAVKLRASDNALRIELERLDVRRDELIVEDRQSARSRDEKFIAAGKDNERADVLAYAAIGALILTILGVFVLVYTDVSFSKELTFLLGNLTGALVIIVKDVYGFEFGSSRGSKDKTDAMTGRRQ